MQTANYSLKLIQLYSQFIIDNKRMWELVLCGFQFRKNGFCHLDNLCSTSLQNAFPTQKIFDP